MNVTSIVLGGSTAPWEAVGVLPPDGMQALAGPVVLEWDLAAPPGIAAVGIDRDFGGGAGGTAVIEGAMWVTSPPQSDLVTSEMRGALGVVGIDHIVWMTDDLERTCAAIESSLAVPLKRVREVGGGVRQGFFRLGSVVLEVVGNPSLKPATSELWGVVLNVSDIAGVAERLGGDVLSTPKQAVQRDRLISTFRQTVGLGTAVALMSP